MLNEADGDELLGSEGGEPDLGDHHPGVADLGRVGLGVAVDVVGLGGDAAAERPGRVELVEIPTDSDANDNVVAYWVPAEAPAATATNGRPATS